MGYLPYQLVQDFFHQQYVSSQAGINKTHLPCFYCIPRCTREIHAIQIALDPENFWLTWKIHWENDLPSKVVINEMNTKSSWWFQPN